MTSEERTNDAEQEPAPAAAVVAGGSKTFLLGVGCQKGGTTWLYDYLGKVDHVGLGPIKEYHVFDLLDLEIGEKKFKRLNRKGSRLLKREKEGSETVKLRLHLLENVDNYFDFFADILSQDAITVTADITPAYAALSADRFALIKEGFERRGIAVKVMFFMRDPVERVWSSVRMMLRDRAERNPDAQVLSRNEEELVLERHETANQRARTNYHLTIKHLEEVFQQEDIFYGFYETLFTNETIQRLCDFLGVPFTSPNFEQRQNESPKSAEISDEVARKIALSYADVYTCARERFGREFIDGIWRSAALLGG